MSPLLFLAFLCMVKASAAPALDPRLDAQWQEWKTKHGKRYSMNEEVHRRAAWEKNMKMIERHNREYREGKRSFTMAMNAFADMASPMKNSVNSAIYTAGTRSWGEDWSMNVYVKMARDRNNHCGIAWMASCPMILRQCYLHFNYCHKICIIDSP